MCFDEIVYTRRNECSNIFPFFQAVTNEGGRDFYNRCFNKPNIFAEFIRNTHLMPQTGINQYLEFVLQAVVFFPPRQIIQLSLPIISEFYRGCHGSILSGVDGVGGEGQVKFDIGTFIPV